MMEQKYSLIETKLIEIVNDFGVQYFKQEQRTSKYCTNEIKKTIGSYGLSQGFKVASSGFIDEFDSEWLYDMVWYTENSENSNLKSIELVLESEMAYGLKNIKFDFEKLLLSNSNHRVMICVAGATPVNDIMKYFENAVITFSNLRTGDRFLALIWDDCKGNGDFIPHLVMKNITPA